jgi:PAS domain S-box-containing protein
MGVKVGVKLPFDIRDIVQRALVRNIPEKIEIQVEKRTYSIAFHPLPEEECINIYGFDISNQREIEVHLREAYEQIQIHAEELSVANEELRVQTDELNTVNGLLNESETKFRTLAENSPDLIARFDKQGNCLYANPASMRFNDIPLLAKFYGWSSSEFIDKTQIKLQIDPEMVKLSENQRATVFTTGKPEATELHYTSSQGKECYFDTKIVPEFIHDEITSVLVISRDIIDRKKAEEMLKLKLEELELSNAELEHSPTLHLMICRNH